MESHRLPSGSTIFRPSTDGWENSTLQAGFADWRAYAFCYRRAAEELAERFRVPLDAPDAMFLPTLYLYRHYVETSLKGILADASTAFSLNISIPSHHSLADLWRQVRTHMTARPGTLGPEWFDRSGQLIQELDRVDPRSMTLPVSCKYKGRASARTWVHNQYNEST
jgi:hypothetical protein